MFLLVRLPAVIRRAGAHIDLNLGERARYTGSAVIPMMLGAIALVVSYFSGPMLNFGDFSRYGKSFEAVKRGNFLGLPVNFLVFSLLVVLTAAATLPVFGELITDPVKTVAKIDNTFAIVLGALTFTHRHHRHQHRRELRVSPRSTSPTSTRRRSAGGPAA